MAQSFTADTAGPLASPDASTRRRVLVTGAAGHIGSYFVKHASKKYQLRLMVRFEDDSAVVEPLKQFGEVVFAELGDLEGLKAICKDVDTVLHLAADPSPSAVWDSILKNNIVGSYNMMVAAKAAGCRRVVYASSIHAVSGYPADVQVKTTDPVNPGDLYGVSKCFTEALCRYMAEKEGLSCIAVRIGAFQPLEAAAGDGGIAMLDAFVSERDLQQLLEKCIDVGELKFAIFHGLSDNRFKRLDITDARELLGFKPVDDLTEINTALRPLRLSERVEAQSMADAGEKSGLRNELKTDPADPSPVSKRHPDRQSATS